MKSQLKTRLVLLLVLLCFLCGCGTGAGPTPETSQSSVTLTTRELSFEEIATEIPAGTTEDRSQAPEQTTADTSNGQQDTYTGTESSLVDTNIPDSTGIAEITTETAPGTTSVPKQGIIKIGLSGMDDSTDLGNYVTAVKKAGCEPVILKYVTTAAEAKALLDTVDALVMTGGEDIDPVWYGEEKLNSSIKINKTRDTSDMLLICEAISRNMPTLCICRGMQILNVACGGSLYQDIPTQYKTSVTHRDKNLSAWKYHEIQTEGGSLVRSVLGTSYTVNSWHHQSVKEPGTNIRITARAGDGIVEAIELTGKTFIVGVQFHPEYFTAMGDKTFLKFFTALANAAS